MFRLGLTCSRNTFKTSSRIQTLRLQSNNTKKHLEKLTNQESIKDDKLREIIQSSNLGSDRVKDSKPQVQDPITDSKTTNNDQSVSGSKVKSNNPINTRSLNKLSEGFGEKIDAEIRGKVDKLPSQREELRNTISKRLTTYIESLQLTIFKATRTLNDVTGYSAIEQLKLTIDKLEAELKDAKDQVKASKDDYTKAIQERSLLQKEINELLTRKHNWSQHDLERFTELYRNDHVNEQREISAQEELTKTEQRVDSIQLKLTQLILTRYHEEQIWSDKIRRASTWGTWFLMGFNIMLFFVATFIVEPWKRKRMVGSFEDKVKQAIMEFSEEQRGKMDKIITNQTRPESGDLKDGAYRFQLPIFSWHNIKLVCQSNYRALMSPEVRTLEFEKVELGLMATVFSVLVGGVASALTVYFSR